MVASGSVELGVGLVGPLQGGVERREEVGEPAQHALDVPRLAPPQPARAYLGANRWPASRRMQPPLSIGFSTIATTSFPYSSGRPMRFGKAASLVRAAANSSGIPCVMPVAKRLGAMARARIPRLPRSRAMVRAMPAMPALAAV